MGKMSILTGPRTNSIIPTKCRFLLILP